MNSVVRIDEGGHLICPGCGSEYLHHATVRVYGRIDEDSVELVKVEVTTVREHIPDPRVAQQPQQPPSDKGNPSARRDGVTIGFWCENCAVEVELVLAQHKGVTEIHWR